MALIYSISQNTTFGGIQGFTQKPETLWYNDAGKFAGIVHQLFMHHLGRLGWAR